MLNGNSDTSHTSAYLLTLPVESRIEYTEKLVDELAQSIWGDAFTEGDKRETESVAGKMMRGVK